MKDCPAMLDRRSPPGARVVCLTDDRSSLIYPDQPSFVLGGRGLVFYGAQGPLLCDLDHDFATRPLFPDQLARSVHVSLDGRYVYYTEHGEANKDRLVLRRLDIATDRTETLFVAEGNLPGTTINAGGISFQTFSLDNRRAATTVWCGDGKTPDAPFGILVLDWEKSEVRIAVEHRDFFNSHLQYCPCPEGDAAHDLLIQMNHGGKSDEKGTVTLYLGPPSDGGADVHAVRDDGSNFRDLPFGRDGRESCIGHQVWRGHTRAAATVVLENQDRSYGWADGTTQQVVAGYPVPGTLAGEHIGRRHRGAKRVVLSRGFRRPRFCHLSCDATGLKFVLDTFPIRNGERTGMLVYVGSATREDEPLRFRYVLNSGNLFNSGATPQTRSPHAHPIMSPSGRELFFNSDLGGLHQAYAVTGVEF